MIAATEPSNASLTLPAARALEGSLCLWAVGTQLSEGIALAGIAATLGALAFSIDRKELALGARAALRRNAPLLAFVAWGFAATFAGGHLPTGTGVARQLDWLAVPVAAAAFARLEAGARRRVAIAAAAMFAVSCLAAGAQHFGLWPSVETFGPLSSTRIPFYRVYEPVPGAEGRYMAGGLLFHRLKFSNVGGLCVLWAWVIGLRSQGRPRALAFAVAGLGLGAIAGFTYARAAAAALLACFLVPALVERPRRRFALGASLALVGLGAGLLLAHRPFRERLLTSASAEGSGGRSYLVAAGLTALRESPVFGVGLGQLSIPRFAPTDAPRHVREHRGKAHNQLLSVAAEQGVVGLFLFAWLWLWLARQMRRDTTEGVAGLTCIAFLLLLGLVHDPLFHPEVSFAAMLALGAGLSPLRARLERRTARA